MTPAQKWNEQIREFEIDWWAWPPGARIPSRGTATEFGRTAQEACIRLRQRFRDIDRIEGFREVEPK